MQPLFFPRFYTVRPDSLPALTADSVDFADFVGAADSNTARRV